MLGRALLFCPPMWRALVSAWCARWRQAKAIVARDIPATREILATYQSIGGVFLYRNDLELVAALRSAMAEGASRVDDSGHRRLG